MEISILLTEALDGSLAHLILIFSSSFQVDENYFILIDPLYDDLLMPQQHQIENGD